MASPLPVSAQCCTPCDGVQSVQVPGTPGLTGAAGEDGLDGANAFTTTTSAFVMPAMGASVSVAVVDTSWMVLGQTLFVQNAGNMEVAAITTANLVSLTNLETAGGAYSANVAPGTNVNAGSKVSPSGVQGQSGAVAWTAAGDIELDGGSLPRIAITSARGSLIVNTGDAVAPRNTAVSIGLQGQMLHVNTALLSKVQWRAIDLSGTNSSIAGTLPVASGGTGAVNAAGARTSLGAAASGANADITSITALSTPLSVAQGGTGVAALQSFRSYKSVAQTVPSGSATKIQYDAESWDAANKFDLTNWRFTPSVAGKYHLSASVELASLDAAKRVEIHIYKNNAAFACSAKFWNASGAAADIQATLDIDVDANGTDWFDARVYHDHGSNRDTTTDGKRNFFSGHWCG